MSKIKVQADFMNFDFFVLRLLFMNTDKCFYEKSETFYTDRRITF